MNKLFSYDGGTFKVLRALGDAELKAYHDGVEKLREFERVFGLLSFVKHNHFEFEKDIAVLMAELVASNGRSPDRKEITPRINLRVLNLLSTMRLYLDHGRFRLSRTYGKESEALARFKKATSKAYDGSFAYRFLYRMRNFAQHCGLPIGHVGVKSFLVDPPNRGKGYEFAVLFRPADLLMQDRQVWGAAVAAEIEALPETVEVAPLVRLMVKELEIIHSETITIETPRAKAAAADVHGVLALAMADGGQGAVGDWTDVPGGGNLTATTPPAEMMSYLGYTGYSRFL